MGDLTGYTLTVNAQETAPPYFIDATIVQNGTSSTQIDPTA